MRMKRSTLITALIFSGAVVFAAVLNSRSAEPATSSDAARVRVRVETLARRSLPGEVAAGGFLRAFADVTIAAERAGRLVALPVAEGAVVKKGAVVAHLDDTVAAANLERARAAARETALEPNASAAELARAEEQLRLAQHEVAVRNPLSPLDGVVEIHHVDVGEFVQPGTPLVDIVDARVLVLDVDVDAEVIGHLARDQEVAVVAASLGDAGRAAGRITRLASRAGARTRRFRVEISVPVADAGRHGTLRAGMHAEARFTLPGGAPALYVPKAATREARGETGVFVVADGVARWRPIHVAEVYHRPDLWRVIGGAAEDGDQLVVSGFSGLRDGAPVEAAR